LEDQENENNAPRYPKKEKTLLFRMFSGLARLPFWKEQRINESEHGILVKWY
jgi:hypothetical protein